MWCRRFVAVVLGIALSLGSPARAHAQEKQEPEAGVTLVSVLRPPPVLDLRLMIPAPPTASGPLSSRALAPEDIRLSRGAKTALIVTAIVVGVLLIAGAVVVTRPGHL
jgi:hypothetical protein